MRHSYSVIVDCTITCNNRKRKRITTVDIVSYELGTLIFRMVVESLALRMANKNTHTTSAVAEYK